VVTSCVVVVVVTAVGSVVQPAKARSITIDRYQLVFMFPPSTDSFHKSLLALLPVESVSMA
jgi:hypothetical protein